MPLSRSKRSEGCGARELNVTRHEPSGGAMSLNTQVRRQALRKLSNGVYVLTSRCTDRFGAATVSWVSQASFKPPLIMAAVRTDSNVFQCLRESRIAALHVVSDEQQDIARRFFSPTSAAAGTINGEPFAEGRTAAPILANLPAHVECHVEQIIETDGDHVVVILRVVEAECSKPFRPLTIADSPWEYGG
jgi:flavin reductase (DIM6/NTAB) family NADH-FMN oxidoreductase RutF